MSYSIPAAYDLFIDNQPHKAVSVERLTCVSPLTGQVLTTVPDAGAADVDAAVQAAARAFPKWSETPARVRQKLLDAFADELVAEADRIAWLETANTGKPWRESHANVLTAAERLRYYAGTCRALEGGSLPVSRDVISLGERTPLGVIGIIGAWNFPLNMFVGKLAPAIATGNTVVYKPADATPITTLEIAAIAARVLPPGVINVVTGRGESTGAALVAHPGVRKITVTGSTETGRRVMQGASHTLKRLTLELGGKNAQIVFPDADLDRAAQGILLGAFLNQGQVCTAGSRIFAHADIAADLKARLLALLPQLKLGDPFDKTTELGALISAQHVARVRDYIALGTAEGARIIYGGEPARVAAYPDGLFLQPTLFDQVRPDMRIAQEEIFGPVALFFEWTDEAEMLAAANGVEQGLAAGVWTSSLSRAHSTARALGVGRVWVNCYNLFPSGAAFGGSKASGFGREDAFETMFDFTEVKNIIIDTAASYRKFYA
jgi:acyl-CoA reductase-like NAD-dependent aldehyde dehydrogenase